MKKVISPSKLVHTFSIVAYDPGKKEWGVAVQSKFLAAAAVVSWAKANAGAVATQSYANVTYGSRGLALMEEGITAEDVIKRLIENDEQQDLRQVGLVDREGKAAAFTGIKCHDWAGHVVGDGYTCQGNILVPGTVEAMAAGCIPVVINKGGQPEIVEHGQSGFLWDTLSELQAQTLELINNPDLTKKISKNALQRSMVFGVDQFQMRVDELLRKIGVP